MKAALIRGLPGLLIALLLAAFAALSPGVYPAHAATDVGTVAAALRRSPVYVDPAASAQLSTVDAQALAAKIKKADKPVFVAVLPDGFPTQNLFQNLRTDTGVTGLYAIRLGTRFDARADSAVLARTGVRNLVTSVQGEPAKTQLNDFTDRALDSVKGSAPSSWGSHAGGGDGGVSTTALIAVGAVVVAGGVGAYTLVRRNRRRRSQEQRAALDKLRVVVDEDITAFGEELDRLDFHPAEVGADDAMRADYERALDAYEQAKSSMAAAHRPEDVRAVTEALEDGRFSLALLAARREGRPLPERRAPCFFDPRHGPSVADATWTPAAARPARSPSARRTGPGWPTATTRRSARSTPSTAAARTGTRDRPTAPGRAATSAAASSPASSSAPCSAARWPPPPTRPTTAPVTGAEGTAGAATSAAEEISAAASERRRREPRRREPRRRYGRGGPAEPRPDAVPRTRSRSLRVPSAPGRTSGPAMSSGVGVGVRVGQGEPLPPRQITADEPRLFEGPVLGDPPGHQ